LFRFPRILIRSARTCPNEASIPGSPSSELPHGLLRSAASGAIPFEADLLPADHKALVGDPDHRHRCIRQAVRGPAANARKMGMALPLGAVVGQFEVPGPFVHEGTMDQTSLDQRIQRPVDRHLVELLGGDSPGTTRGMLMRNRVPQPSLDSKVSRPPSCWVTRLKMM